MSELSPPKWVLSNQFIAPRYTGPCFANLPNFAHAVLTGDSAPWLSKRAKRDYQNVVFLFVDSFGWSQLEKFRTFLEGLEIFQAEPEIFRATSQFPSTTAAHVTTLSTGLPVSEHGILEWYYYEPILGEVIAPLLYSFVDRRVRDSLLSTIPSEEILPFRTFFEALGLKGIESFLIQHRDIAFSAYGGAMSRGGRVLPYDSPMHSLKLLTELISGPGSQKRFIYYYYDRIDALGHEFGPNSPKREAGIKEFFTALNEQLRSHLDRETLFVLFADHGMTDVSPARVTYVDRELPELSSKLLVTKQGKPIAPCGSSRDIFLHVKPAYETEVFQELRDLFAHRAEVYRVSDLCDARIFGPSPSVRLRERAGQIVVLPFAGEGAFWFGNGQFEQHFLGNHGGLTPEEVEIPIILF